MNPAQEARVRESFARQAYMGLLGAELVHVAAGEVDIAWPFNPSLVQQDGFLHAGVVSGVTDSACGYAALTLCEDGTEVLTVEFKVNLLAPASAPRVVARARVLRAGKTITVCRADVFGLDGDDETLVATMLGTMMTRPR